MVRGWLGLACAAMTALPSAARPAAAHVCADVHAADARTDDARGGGLPDLTKLAHAALPAVVGVVTTQGERDPATAADPTKDLFDRFRGPVKKGLATGFIIDRDGFVVTNAHVVEDANRIEVELGEDQERLPARVVGRDEASDVALLKVDAGRPLPVLPLGDSDRLQVAEWIMVVGNPFGLSRSVTVGIVSQVDRSDIAPAGRDGFYDFIQTDASINPGNSGGPLLNLRGEVVGIATAINATGQGIGFAVPINMARDILRQLRESGRIVRSWMGVSVREARVSAPRHTPRHREVVVTEVISGGPAAAGGLQVGDVITGFEGLHILSAARLRWRVATAGVGRSVSLTVRRGSDERAMTVRLSQQPGAETAAAAPPGGEDNRPPPRPLRPAEQ